jgi:hypothetical protein
MNPGALSILIHSLTWMNSFGVWKDLCALCTEYQILYTEYCNLNLFLFRKILSIW